MQAGQVQCVRQRRTLWMAMALAATVSACAEPVDCALEPGRCLPPAHTVAAHATQAPPTVAPVQAQPTKINTAAIVAAGRALEQVGAGPRRVDQVAARPAMLPGDTLAARGRNAGTQLMAPRDKAMGAEAGDEDRKNAVRKLFSALLPGIKAHDYAQIKSFATDRFAGQFAEIKQNYDQRFWTHVDKYVTVLTGAKLDMTIENMGDNRVQAVFKNPPGQDLKAILVFDNGAWKIDRF